MGKNSRRKRKSRSAGARQAPPSKGSEDAPKPSPLVRAAKLVGAAAGAAVAVVGLLLAAGQYLSPLSGVPTRSTEKEPFMVPFRITNTGFVAAKDVQIRCIVRHVELAGDNQFGDIGYGQADFSLKSLGRNKTKDVVCPVFAADWKALGMPKSATLAVVVEYGASFVPFRRFRDCFGVRGSAADQWDWLTDPTSDEDCKRFFE